MKPGIIHLDDHRPHVAAYVACIACAHDWTAVFPASALPLECPRCSAMEGEVIKTDNIDWFKRFMAGSDANKRRIVVMNAHRMGL